MHDALPQDYKDEWLVNYSTKTWRNDVAKNMIEMSPENNYDDIANKFVDHLAIKDLNEVLVEMMGVGVHQPIVIPNTPSPIKKKSKHGEAPRGLCYSTIKGSNNPIAEDSSDDDQNTKMGGTDRYGTNALFTEAET
jgi:hypothetical protein